MARAVAAEGNQEEAKLLAEAARAWGTAAAALSLNGKLGSMYAEEAFAWYDAAKARAKAQESPQNGAHEWGAQAALLRAFAAQAWAKSRSFSLLGSELTEATSRNMDEMSQMAELRTRLSLDGVAVAAQCEALARTEEALAAVAPAEYALLMRERPVFAEGSTNAPPGLLAATQAVPMDLLSRLLLVAPTEYAAWQDALEGLGAALQATRPNMRR